MITVSVLRKAPGVYVGRVSVNGQQQWRSSMTATPDRARKLATEVAKALRSAVAQSASA